MELVCGIDPHGQEVGAFPVFADAWPRRSRARTFDVLVDFTQPSVVAGNLRAALPAGVDCVVGTTGLSNETVLEELAALAPGGHVPVLRAELHHGRRAHDGVREGRRARTSRRPRSSSSTTATRRTPPRAPRCARPQIISEARGGRASEAPGRETEIEGAEGARGALVDGVPVHSVRSMGYVASQEVVFGSLGQTLSIRHDSWDRASYMPGVLLGIRSVGERSGLIVGLENFMA